MRRKWLACFVAVLSLLIFGLAPSKGVAGLPQATEKMLKQFKLDASALSGLDEELDVPAEWIEGAKAEGELMVRGSPATPGELQSLLGPFKERYPFLKVDYYGANRQGRTLKTLMAYKTGRHLADVVISVGTFVTQFHEANGLEDLRVLPAFKNVPDELKDREGIWVGINKNYWCMTYNTDKVNKKDLPQKWEDLLTNPTWREGNLALGNRPNLWAVNLWMAQGEEWTKHFLSRLFTEVKPQLRKEGMNALPQLVAAGEFHGAIPSNYKRPYQILQRGAPIGFTCPEPIPGSTEEAIILKGAPHVYAGKLFLNWILSKEGQIAQYAHEYAAPLDETLRVKLMPFSDQILGKKESYRDPKLEDEVMPQLFDVWNDLWLKGGGTPRRR